IAGLPEIKSVRIILRRDKSAFVTELPCIKPAGSNGYLLIFDQCSYFDMWRYDSNPDALPWQIGFYLMADGEEYVCRCENMVIPQQINAGSSMFKALIYDLKGNVCGRIYFDIRIINEELLAAEQEARKSWSAGDKQALAQQLGKGAGNFINANFASAVNVFGQISCTNTKNYFSAINYEK
ncbi:MAG TPA: hypothetical protein VHO66_02980, partial [Ruminiclostridium sp.]|nr:hypothetical protein [Ruminiclostridium sp.]